MIRRLRILAGLAGLLVAYALAYDAAQRDLRRG
jgi:hypothetical protein